MSLPSIGLQHTTTNRANRQPPIEKANLNRQKVNSSETKIMGIGVLFSKKNKKRKEMD